MAIADSHGLPIAVRVTSASPNESTLVEDTLAQRHIAALPKRLIGDKAYDSDRLDERLRQPARHRNDRSQPAQEKENPGRTTASPLPAPMEDRTAVRLAEELPPTYQPMGTLRRQLPRHGPTWLRVDPVEASMRLFLVFVDDTLADSRRGEDRADHRH